MGKFATFTPEGIARTSGSLPRLPISMTLLRDAIVPSFSSPLREDFSPRLRGRALVERCCAFPAPLPTTFNGNRCECTRESRSIHRDAQTYYSIAHRPAAQPVAGQPERGEN